MSEFELAALRRHTTYLSARLRGVITTGFTGEAAPGLLAYVVRVPGNGRPDRDAFKRALRARGVQCEVPVQTPLHWTRAFHTAQSLPETERASAECLSLLLRPRMTKRELQKIVSGCNALGGLLMEPAC
ncbi:DegT/DnrJ/EryC1/StrS family aminotransferase [Streptomyces sp. NPDC005438]|uniref:DegT/DnrJ/EryC1/StrS family aminotransferase n=1 Tax=Streptomyces sp. NPDC005438 TaxID=3156880 RepID=UPI0033A85A4F